MYDVNDPDATSGGPLDLAVFRPKEGAGYLTNQYVFGSDAMRVQWGRPGDIPVTSC